MIGQVFGALTVIKLEGQRPSKRRRDEYIKQWRCKCVCGNEKVVIGSDLTGHRVRSCGCATRHIAFKFSPELDQTLKDFYPDFGAKQTAKAIFSVHKVKVSVLRVKKRACYLGIKYQGGRPGRRKGSKIAAKLDSDEALYESSITLNAFICQPWTQGVEISRSPENELYRNPESVSRLVEYHRDLKAIVDERRESVFHDRWRSEL